MEIHTLPTPDQLAEAVAEFVYDLGAKHIAQHGAFSLVLSGGGTPRPAYQRLAELSQPRDFDWNQVHIFWGDERCVPPDHVQSNFRMAREALFDHLVNPPGHLNRIACTGDPAGGAESYEQTLREHFPDQAFPPFDLILLGLGMDGHTASLFPNTPIMEERVRWVAPVYVPRLESWRVSLTLPAINAAQDVAFLVSGAEKADVIHEILEPGKTGSNLPAALIQPRRELHWFLDRDAASRLSKVSTV